MKSLFTVLGIFITLSLFSQVEFSLKKVNDYFVKHPLKHYKIGVNTPTSGQGLIIYGTPSVITDFLTVPFKNGVFQTPDGSVDPGLQYTFELAHYVVETNSVPVINYCGIGGFLVAGGMGNSTSPRLKGSIIAGVAANISSYVTVGYGYDPINKTGSLVVGGKFDLSALEQAKLATIFWIKQQ